MVVTVDAPTAADGCCRRDAPRRPCSAEIPFVSTAAVLFVYPEGTAGDAARRVGVRRAARRRADDRLHVAVGQVARPRVRRPGGAPLLRRRRRRGGRRSRRPTRTSIDACARHLTALLPLPERPEHAAVVRWPRGDAAVPRRPPRPGRRDPRRAAGGYLRDGAIARRRRRRGLRARGRRPPPSRSPPTSHRRTAHDRHAVRPVPGVPGRSRGRARCSPTPRIAAASTREVEDLFKRLGGPCDGPRLVLDGRVPRRRRPDAVARRRPPPRTCSRRWSSSGGPRSARILDLTWTFMGVVKPAEFSPDHQPAFVKGDPPQDYLCVYPFVRTAEWYLLPRRGAFRDAPRPRRYRPRVPRGARQHDERLRPGRLGVDPRVRVAEARVDRRRDPAAAQHRGAPLHEGRGALRDRASASRSPPASTTSAEPVVRWRYGSIGSALSATQAAAARPVARDRVLPGDPGGRRADRARAGAGCAHRGGRLLAGAALAVRRERLVSPREVERTRPRAHAPARPLDDLPVDRRHVHAVLSAGAARDGLARAAGGRMDRRRGRASSRSCSAPT